MSLRHCFSVSGSRSRKGTFIATDWDGSSFQAEIGRKISKPSRSLQKEERALMHLLELSMQPAKRRRRTASHSS